MVARRSGYWVSDTACSTGDLQCCNLSVHRVGVQDELSAFAMDVLNIWSQMQLAHCSAGLEELLAFEMDGLILMIGIVDRDHCPSPSLYFVCFYSEALLLSKSVLAFASWKR